jgi:hypothetical protein
VVHALVLLSLRGIGTSFGNFRGEGGLLPPPVPQESKNAPKKEQRDLLAFPKKEQCSSGDAQEQPEPVVDAILDDRERYPEKEGKECRAQTPKEPCNVRVFPKAGEEGHHKEGEEYRWEAEGSGGDESPEHPPNFEPGERGGIDGDGSWGELGEGKELEELGF